jgi:pyridoxamine 5'-phosphate oxidase
MKFSLRQLFTSATHMNEPLDERSVGGDPIALFQLWFAEARKEKIMFPDAMTIATVNAKGHPAARMVLLKSVDERGFVFFTNYRSAKGREIESHPHVALVVHWDLFQRQVRIEGPVTRIAPEESDAYFATRPRASQLSAHASPQSEIVEDRETLDAEYRRIEEQFEGKTVTRPPHWGGLRVQPVSIEFWKGRIGRLHDRILFERAGEKGWTISRLAP